MKQFIQKIGKKRLFIICAAIVILMIAAAVLVAVFSGNKTPQNIVNQVDHNYSELAKKEVLTATQADKALKDYAKEQQADKTVYTKGKETIVIKTDENGNVTYLSYTHSLGSDEKVELKNFNESMIKIGDNEEDVMELLKKDIYVYQLKTINDEGQKLHIYYYGWTSKEAILELVFTDGKLTYYTINSQDIAKQSDAPDLEDFN